jgi:Ran GTPase-activating protein (RanGAP) involved in mRNA processing and transport
VKDLDLSYTGLDDDGMKEICEAIKENETITNLNLSSNHFGEVGANYLIDALVENKSLKNVDLSRNALGFRSIHSLVNCCSNKNLNLSTSGNYVFEEIMNSVSHGIAFLVAVVGTNVLISDAVDTYVTDYHFWACILYSFSLLFLFLSSCLFHSFFMLPQSKIS